MNLSKFLEEKANENGYNTGKFSDNYIFKIDQDIPKGESGVVYGFVVELSKTELQNLFEEAMNKKANKQLSLIDIKPIYKSFYPLYWGKSSDSFGRINAHIKGHKSNSNLRLKDFNTLKNKDIIYARIFLEENVGFEKYLLGSYPPILKTRSV